MASRTLLHVASGWPPQMGGGILLGARVSEGLARRGHVVHVLPVPGAGHEELRDLASQPRPPGVHVFPVPPFLVRWNERIASLRRWHVPGRGEIRRAFRAWRNRILVREVAALAATLRPDCLLLSCSQGQVLRAFARERALRARPLLAVTQSHLEDPKWDHRAARRLWRSVPALAVNTPYEAEALATRYGVDAEACVVTGCGAEVPVEPGPWPRPPQVLYLGRLHQAKGVDLLLAAMRRVWGRRPEARLVVAGALCATAERVLGWIEALSPEDRARVDVRPDVPEPEKARLLASSACLALPSIHESFGIVLLEAMAHGTPVVALDTPVERCVVEAGVTGLLVPRGDPEAMAAALERLLGDAAAAARIGLAGRRAMAERHGWDQVAARYEAAVERAIERHAATAAAASAAR